MRRALGLTALVVGCLLTARAIQLRQTPVSQPPEPTLHRARRSILLITLDTTRADHLEPYGARNVETPNLQRLANDGATFERAFAVAPITLPSHTSIHTGLYPFQTGVRNNGTHHAPASLTTLSERLSDAGYHTAAFVSASVLERRYGLDQGFGVYDDDLSTGRERHPRVVPDRPAEATIAAARAWLDLQAEDELLFLWVHLYDPHAVYSPPPPFRNRYKDRLYDGELAYMDGQIGRLLGHPRLVNDANLVVVAVGDHGESLGEHKERTHGILAYDATLQIPLLIRVPGAPAGLRIEDNVSQIDLVPTLLDLLDLDPDPSLPGKSLVPALEGNGGVSERSLYSETYLPFYTYGWAKLRVLRFGRWKYVEAPDPELFDLKRDPRELSNLADQRPGRAHDLRHELREVVAKPDSLDQENVLELDLDSLEKLRSLGYVAMGSTPATAGIRRLDPKAVIGLHASLERARGFLTDRLFDLAEQELRAALAKDRNNIAFLRELSAALEGQGRFDEAVDVVTRALSLDPGAANLYLTLSTLENRRGHADQALLLIDQALARDPEFLEAHLQRAQLLHALHRPDEAQEVLEKALIRHPDNPRINLLYAQLVETSRMHWKAAAARLQKALGRDPFMAAGWLRLGQVREKQGRVDESIESFREGLKRAPDSAELHANLGRLLASLGTGAEAELHLREAIRLSRDFKPELHVTLGAWLAEHSRPEEALLEYEGVLKVRPRDPSARNNHAIALFQLGRVNEAEQELLVLTREIPENANAYSNLAAIAMQREDWPSMEANARKALELAPNMVEAWSNLGIALSRLGRADEAAEALRTAAKLEPSYWQARYNLAAALARQGRAQEAAQLYRDLLREVPSPAEVFVELGNLYSGPLQDESRAREFYNAFLRHVPPTDIRVPVVRQRLAEIGRISEESRP